MDESTSMAGGDDLPKPDHAIESNDARPDEAKAPAVQPAAPQLTSPPPSGGLPAAARVFVTRNGEPAPHLYGLYSAPPGAPGSSLFVVLSGPSAKKAPKDLLQRRGVTLMCVNNSAAIIRPHIWTHVDPCYKFHHSIWQDPAVLKIMSDKFFSQNMRIKKEDGHFELSPHACRHMPNTFGYRRNANFNPAAYMEEDSINWGNSKRSIIPPVGRNPNGNNHPHVLNVMFVVLRLPFLLGFRKIYLVGCDFRMTHESDAYGFEQQKHAGAVDSNNSAYIKINHMTNLLLPHFKKHGYEIFNCTPDSGLLAFPYIPLEKAVADATAGIPDTLDTRDWYTSDEGKPVKQPRQPRQPRRRHRG